MFYLKYAGPLPAENDVKVDITNQERIVSPLQERVILRGYDEFNDIPGDRRIQVYSLEEIAIEKVMALADRARNEPRDLYDLWYLTENAGVDSTHLEAGIRAKWEFRGPACDGISEAIRAKEARLKALWSKRLAYQMTNLQSSTKYSARCAERSAKPIFRRLIRP
jgi:predicted nucleotidyltransferase component of viral defense system